MKNSGAAICAILDKIIIVEIDKTMAATKQTANAYISGKLLLLCSLNMITSLNLIPYRFPQ